MKLLPRVRQMLALALATALLLVCGAAEVVINEISAVHSDRLVQRAAGGQQKLGTLPAWYEAQFAVPAWWSTGAGPFGFGYTQTTNLQSAMLNKTPALYVRREFSVSAEQAGSAESLELLINYDDGFVAYVNGTEVARRNTGAPGSFAWHHQPAFNVKTATGVETIGLGVASGLLREGANVLAIQVHNNAISDPKLHCAATLRLGGATPQNLVVPSESWRFLAGTHEPSGGLYDPQDISGVLPKSPDWTQPEFADAGWTAAPGALGFDTAADYLPQLGTNLTGMRTVASALYMRREFILTPEQYEALGATSLTVDFDDGYVLYLNGYELSRSNVPGAPGSFVPFSAVGSAHPASRDDGGNNPAAIRTITVPKKLLRAGRNVLAAQVHNASKVDADLLLDVLFSGTSAGTTLTFVGPGSMWRYLIGTAEIGTAPPPGETFSAPEFVDWIELKNTDPVPVDVGGWSLTDEADEPGKWRFPPGTTIPPSGFLVVAATGRNITAPSPGGMLHTDFGLGAKGEYLGLHDPAGVLRSVLASVPDQDAFHTWGFDAASGQYRFFERGTPGAENNVGLANEVAEEVEFDKATGFYAEPPTLALASGTAGATIRYTLDGSDPAETGGIAYTGPFLPSSQENVGPGAGTILREFFQWTSGRVVTPPNFPSNSTPTNTQLITALETPTGAGDYYTHRVRGFLHAPESGAYEFWLATDDDGELWLSTDENPANKRRIANIVGNWTNPREWTKLPSQRSALITLAAGQRYYIEVLQSEGSGGDNCAVGWSGPGLPAGINVIAGRYLSPPATLPPGTQQPPGAAVVRARAFAPGLLPSEVRTRNYVIGLDPRAQSIPAFFLTGPGSDTFYSNNGIFAQVGGNWNSNSWVPNNPRTDYNFALMQGDAFERLAGLEILAPGNTLLARTNAGIRFSGSPWSRPQYRLQDLEAGAWSSGWVGKPQINVFFRGDFGISKLALPGFLPTSRLDEWDQLRLRAGKNDAYNPFIVDEWTRRTFAEMGAPAPQGTFATLFLNARLKGYFNVTERVREPFFRGFYGSENAWDINFIGDWEGGDATAYTPMLAFFRGTDFTPYANYQRGAEFWDMTNVADYFIMNAWAATKDWPHNNYAFVRERVAGAKWRFSMWDAEGAMGSFGQSNQTNTFQEDLAVSQTSTIGAESRPVALVFRRAYQNAEFRLLFADRLQKHFFNGGPMTRAKMNARWGGLRSQIEPVIAALGGGAFSAGNWNNWSSRDGLFLSQCRTLGMWPATIAPVMSPLGGRAASVTLTNSNPNGVIHYTTDGTDPRAVGGAAVGATYVEPIAISAPLVVRARVRSDAGEWSPLMEANFVPGDAPRIVVSELHYNPPGPDDLTEFIELTNVGTTSTPLNGARFTEGVGFTFGNVTVEPGASLVLVRDAAAFASAYPGVPIAGVFTGDLDNGGETLTLRDLAENTIFSFTYYDGNVPGWSADADGRGATLVLRNPFAAGDAGLPASWRASYDPGGAPGARDSTVFAGDPLADLDGDGFSALVEYSLGTNDIDAASLPALIPGRDASGRGTITFICPVAADDVTIDAFESSDLATWSPAVFDQQANAGPGRRRVTWRAEAADPQVFLRLRIRKN